MGGWKNPKGPSTADYLRRAFGSTSDLNLARHPDSDPRPEQSSGEQQQAISRSSRFFEKLKWRSPSPSSSPRIQRRNSTTNHPLELSASQSLAVPASVLVRPHSSYSGSSPTQTHRPSLHDPLPLASDAQGSSFISINTPIIQRLHPQSEPTASETSATVSPLTCAPYIPTSTYKVLALAETGVHATALPETKSTPGPDVIETSSFFSGVWAKALEIAQKKLSEHKLPLLDLLNLTSETAEENIQAVIKGLHTLQEDDKKKRWSYMWHGKEVIVVECLGKILRSAEEYTKVVDTVIQTNPQLSAIVWAGVWAILRVRDCIFVY